MTRTITIAAVAFALVAVISTEAPAQMRNYEQSMMRLKNKLPTATFDGRTLHVKTYKELQNVASFVKNFRTNLEKAIQAWNKLDRGRTQQRKNALVANQQYYKALAQAFQQKVKEIPPPAKPKVVKDRVIQPDEIFIGPDVASTKPIIIDTIGPMDTLIRVWGSPGSSSKPSKWSAKLHFWVRYNNIVDDDVVLIQVLKGRKKLGKPTPCRPKGIKAKVQLAYFECLAPRNRDYPNMFNSDGQHTVALTYKKPIEGTVFKNFATLKVSVKKLKKGASNNPNVAWGTDHDMKLTVSTIEEKTNNGGSGLGGHTNESLQAAFRQGIPYMAVHTWLKREKRVERTKLTCMYKGKRVAESQDVGGQNYDYWSYVKKGSPKRDDAKWDQQEYLLYQLHPRPGPGGNKGSWATPQHWMNENPGDYRCVVTGEGDVIKEIYFTVGADGEIVKPTCQAKSFNTLHTVTLLTTKDHKLSDRSYDKKIGRKFGYEGRIKWSRGCPPTK